MTRRSDDMPHIVFSGGRTGGHLFPGLAVAEHLRTFMPDCRITFCGSGCRFDRIETHRAGFPYIGLPTASIPKSLRSGWQFLSKNFRGLRAAGDFIDREQVSLVVGLGGFSSVPMAWAAERRKLPLVLLEQNIVPGRATRWLASSADVVCLPWPEARKNLPRSINVQITGNPVRSEFVNCGRTSAGSQTRPIGSQTRPSLENQGIAKIQSLATSATAGIADRKTRRLVIFGGSQGARQLNEEVPKALYKLHGMLAGWEIIHQSGEAACAATKRRYDNLQVPACVVPFVHHPATVLRKADLVICRAGGTTLAELTAVGVPAILIPYRHSAGDHQRHNAEFFARSGAAVVIDTCQRHRRTDNLLVQALQTPLSNDERRESMRRAMRRLARADAAMHVSDAILSLLRLERVNRAA